MKVFLVIVGVLIVFLRWNWVTAKKREEQNRTRTNQWFALNKGKVVFFFPCKAKIQKIIFDKIIPFINESTELAYYEVPTVICTLEPFPTPYLLKNAYNSNIGFQLGTLCLLEISGEGFLLKEDLSELKNANDSGFDFATIINRINANL